MFRYSRFAMSNSPSPSSSSSNGSPMPKPRTLVLCFDGTSNQYTASNTNVVKFFSLLKKDDPSEQVCYYQAGVGTYFNPGVVSPLFHWAAAVLDEAIAWYLDQHVMDGYQFLMQNYRVGDKICLFGFSRGAYTARAVAGMLLKVGLLPKDNEQQTSFAYKLYKRTDAEGIKLSAGFKQTFCQSVSVEFIGVWDTVASTGVVMGKSLPFIETNADVKTFRQALSLDEHRAKFRPNFYHRVAPGGSPVLEDAVEPAARPSSTTEATTAVSEDTMEKGGVPPRRFSFKRARRCSPKQMRLTKDGALAGPVRIGSYQTDVLETWFAGCHSDVGGSSVPDTEKICLSDISLRWMVRQVMASQCGILFEPDALARMSIPAVEFPAAAAAPGEVQQEAADALAPLHDQLKANVLWWLLEIVPLSYSWQDAKGVWHKKWSFHLGAGRIVPEDHPTFHATVKDRISDAPLKYKPKAKYTPGTEVYVE